MVPVLGNLWRMEQGYLDQEYQLLSVEIGTQSIPISLSSTPSAIANALSLITPLSITITSYITPLLYEFNLTFATTAGNIPQISLDTSAITGTAFTSSVTTLQDGSYAPLGGTFQLGLASTLTNPIVFNADNATLAAAIQVLPGIGVISVTTVSATTSLSLWRITFLDSWRPSFNTNLRNLKPYGSLLTGTNATVVLTPVVKAYGLDVPLFVTQNGQDYVDTNLNFTYHEVIVVDSVDPTNGPIEGGTAVLVNLSSQSMNFSLLSSSFCRFGSIIVTGTVINPKQVRCLSPARGYGNVSVEISANGMDFSTSKIAFEYRLPLQLQSISPLHGPIGGGTLVTIAVTAINLLDVYTCNVDGQVAFAEKVNATHVFCRTPPVASPRKVPIEVTCNNQNFTASGLHFEYKQPLYLTSITPAWGAATGGNTVKIRGGVFDRTLPTQCRFGEKVVDALVISEEYVSCKPPQFDPIGQVQSITTSASGFVPDVQEVVVSATPDQPNVQVIETSGNIPAIETHMLSIWGANTPEVQLVQPTVDTISTEIRSVSTKMTPTITEVKTISLQATAINEVQQISVGVNSASLAAGQLGIQSLSMPLVSTENGTFAVEFKGLRTAPIPYICSTSQLQSALEALDTVGPLQITLNSQNNYRVWTITFLQNTGVLPLLIVDATLLTTVSPSLIIVRSLQATSTIALGGTFSISYNGQITSDLPVRSSASDIAFALQALPNVQNPVVVTRSNLDCNGGATWTVTFVSTPAANGNLPLMVVQTSKLTGTAVQSNVTPISHSNSIGGSFKLSFQGALSATLYPTTTESAMAGAIQALTQIPVASVTRSGPTSVSGYSWSVTFGGTPTWIPDITGVSSLTGVGATVQVATTRVAQVLEVQKLTLSASSFIGGSFMLKFKGQQTLPIPSNASAANLQNSLNALSNIGQFQVTKSASDIYGGSSWQITFQTLAGNQDLIQVITKDIYGNQTLFDYGSRDLSLVMTEVQRGVGAGINGAFQIIVDGQISGPIPFDATPKQLQTALEIIEPVQVTTSGILGLNNIMDWIITFTTPKATPRQLSAETTMLTPGSAFVQFGTVQTPIVQEIRSISTALTSGNFICTFGGKTSGPVAFDADSTAMISAFSVIGDMGSLSISGSNPWQITFTQLAGSIPTLDCGIGQTVNVIQTSTSSKLSWFFKLGYNNIWSAPISPSDTALSVQTALNSLLGSGSVSVSGSNSLMNNGRSWEITFTNMPGVQPLLSVDTSLLGGTNPQVIVTRKTTGSQVTGSFQLAINGQLTDVLPPNISARDMTTSLQKTINCSSCISVVRSAPLGAGGFNWTIQVLPYDASTQSFTSQILPNYNQFSLVNISLSCPGLVVQMNSLLNGSDSIGGNFVLRYRDQPTVNIPWYATAEAMQLAIQHIKSIPPGNFRVTCSGPYVTGGMQWRITFPFNVPYPQEVFKANSNLTGTNVSISITVASPQTIPVQGTFKLQFQNQLTNPIAFNANATQMAFALQALPNVGTVNVTIWHTPRINIWRWRVSFISLNNAGNLPLVTCPSFGVTGTLVNIIVKKLVNGTQNQIQAITVSSQSLTPSGTFGISFSGVQVSASISASATASDLIGALNGVLPSLGAVRVERWSASNGQNGFTWYILIQDSYQNKPLFSLNTQNTFPKSDLVATVTSIDSTTIPIQGTFIVQYGEVCIDGLDLSSSICTPSTTSSLAYNVDELTLQHELSLLPGLEGVSVTRSAGNYLNGFTWLVSFPQLLGNLALLTTQSSLTGLSAKLGVGISTIGVTFDDAKVPVAVTQNGQDYTLSSTVVYRYTPTILVHEVYPKHGPTYGGTEVVVRGDYFTNSSLLYCRFGMSFVTVAAYRNSTHLTCVTPPIQLPGQVIVDVSTNGQGVQSTISNSTTAVFTYDPPVALLSVTPSLGPMTGNFSVLIYGGPFLPTNELRCRFGSLIVIGVWIQTDAIRCIAPSYTSGTVALEVSINDQDYTSSRTSFYFYPNPTLHRIYPVFGPAFAAGTSVDIFGTGFVNTSNLVCRFGKDVVPSIFISPTRIQCLTPSLNEYSGGLQLLPLSEQRNTYADPSSGSRLLFPSSHYYPLVQGRLASVEISNNQQDFTFTGINYLFYQDPVVSSIQPTELYAASTIGLFVAGRNFINSTSLTCRVGVSSVKGVFVSPSLVLCQIKTHQVKASTPRTFTKWNDLIPTFSNPYTLFVEIANNGVDFTGNRISIQYLGPCPTGYYCPLVYQGRKLPCPRGAYCPGQGNANFTLCPRGTYQPLTIQSACLRCPIGYHCPHVGLHVPRICPAGFVCEVTGIETADQPCPQGHFCLEGTATTATTCGQMVASRKLSASYTQAERGSTIRKGRLGEGLEPVLGARQTGCWDNSTQDFGLQLSSYPSRFWMELQQMPISETTLHFLPIRGRYCMDDTCMRVASPFLALDDPLMDYQNMFALRRPVPCPTGMYCHPGTAGNSSVLKNFTSPQPCFESMYCPEGSESPTGQGDCPAGFYCPFGIKIPCPAGTYCPLPGSFDPLGCPPGTFNAMVGQTKCTPCPEGYICPGFNRIQPVLCPSGYVCSKPQLASPNIRCPPGYYCYAGRLTSDPFRNDTTLRPYPCKPGTYCLGGVISDTVVTGNFDYAQNCTAGFYCELGSSSPKGIGMCPPGFYCPSGTAIPIPTPKGSFAARNGTVQSALCPPNYYAPTIETIECYPCPPGTTCPEDGTAVATICPPGTYRSTLSADGVACVPCPQGTWSKNWGLREVGECILCPPGTVCATDGMTNPCSKNDFPLPYVPTNLNESEAECLARGSKFYFGVLLEPWIEPSGSGPHFLPHMSGECYYNPQPLGSPLYLRFTEYFGPLFDIATGAPHQGYGDANQVPGYFERGSLFVDLTHSTLYDLKQNCTRGFFYEGKWFPGTCEADVICHSEETSQALICPDGYICDEKTTDGLALETPCAPGFVCGYGTTPDVYLESPMGQYKMLCPRSHYCLEGTGVGLMNRQGCPANYFCPTGTVDPYMGYIANDAERRNISADDANPFLYVDHIAYLREGDVREFSRHDKRCLDGIDPELLNTYYFDAQGNIVNAAIENQLLCARDNKWYHVYNAINRRECNCHHQVQITLDLFRLWQCSSTQLGCAINSSPWLVAVSSSLGLRFPAYSSKIYKNFNQIADDVTKDMQVYLAPHQLVKGVSYTLQAPDELYNLYTAVQHIKMYRENTLDWINFLPNSNEILRLDMCECQRLFKCPNGTSSPVGSDSIFDCVKTGIVLRRWDLIPQNHSRQVNGKDKST
ncbi:hypothetical protein LEN26_000103 [Aphanomyces euteiches]|nr:hypothetical protein LEN26_000103 [Aphanomyces euteiches]